MIKLSEEYAMITSGVDAGWLIHIPCYREDVNALVSIYCNIRKTFSTIVDCGSCKVIPPDSVLDKYKFIKQSND